MKQLLSSSSGENRRGFLHADAALRSAPGFSPQGYLRVGPIAENGSAGLYARSFSPPAVRLPKSMAFTSLRPLPRSGPHAIVTFPLVARGATHGGAAAHNVDGAPASTHARRIVGSLCQHAAHNVDSSFSYRPLPGLRASSDDFKIRNKKKEHQRLESKRARRTMNQQTPGDPGSCL